MPGWVTWERNQWERRISRRAEIDKKKKRNTEEEKDKKEYTDKKDKEEKYGKKDKEEEKKMMLRESPELVTGSGAPAGRCFTRTITSSPRTWDQSCLFLFVRLYVMKLLEAMMDHHAWLARVVASGSQLHLSNGQGGTQVPTFNTRDLHLGESLRYRRVETRIRKCQCWLPQQTSTPVKP